VASVHHDQRLWTYTPRKIKAYIFLAERRRDRDRYETLALGALAARGKEDTLNKQLQAWEKEMD